MGSYHYLEFEGPLKPLDEKIDFLESRRANLPEGMNVQELEVELKDLQKQLQKSIQAIHAQLTSWQKVQMSRHPDRPYARDYLEHMIDDFVELHGDRRFAEDPAIISGVGTFRGQSLVFLGQQKGRNTKQKIYRNFGMPRPEGYRKAMRMMELAERFRLPILSLVDTPGAYPGIGAEERGQSLAIAENLVVMSKLKTPHITVVIGEGGSGGALAMAMGDRVFMLEHSIYSVISPESCAAILWKDASEGPRAADALKISAQDAVRLKVIDGIIPEPLGGAHRDLTGACKILGDHLERTFSELTAIPIEQLTNQRFDRYRNIGP